MFWCGEAVTKEEKSKQIWEYLMKNDPLITVWSRVSKLGGVNIPILDALLA